MYYLICHGFFWYAIDLLQVFTGWPFICHSTVFVTTVLVPTRGPASIVTSYKYSHLFVYSLSLTLCVGLYSLYSNKVYSAKLELLSRFNNVVLELPAGYGPRTFVV